MNEGRFAVGPWDHGEDGDGGRNSIESVSGATKLDLVYNAVSDLLNSSNFL